MDLSDCKPAFLLDVAQVREDLAGRRRAHAALARLGPRPLTPGLRLLLWGLRLYVLGMTAVLAVHAFATL